MNNICNLPCRKVTQTLQGSPKTSVQIFALLKEIFTNKLFELSLLIELLHRLEGIFDRRLGVRRVEVKQIDAGELQIAQRGLKLKL